MKHSLLSAARRSLRTVPLVGFSLALLALPATSWGCTAQGNSIFANPCADPVYGASLVQFESDSVQAYLTLHGLPSTDSLVVYGYGRSDLRTEIRGLMLVRLLAIVSKAPSDRNALETSIYNWFLNRVWQNEISMAAAAVADKTNFLADKCDWTPDPDIASQYGFVYEGGAFCNGQLLQLFASPTVPAESYFQAAAFKKIYGGSLSGQPGGPSIMAATLSSLATTQAYAVIPAVAAAVAFSSAVGQNITSILLATAQRLSLAAKTAARAIEAGLEVTEDVEPEIVAGESSLGPGIVVGIMLEAGVSAGTEAWEADQTLATLGDLDTRYTAAQAAPPDLLSLLNDDTGTGILKLNASFVSATLPEVFVVTALPVHGPTDALFQISTGGGTPVSSAQLTYQDWNHNVWTASTWRGWFVQSNVSNGNTFYSITATLRGLYPGSPVNDEITAGRYSADRFVVAPTNSFNISCPIDPATGESDTQGAPAVEFCSSFVVRQLLLFNGSGVLQNVTLPVQVPPVFPDGPTRILNFNTNSSNTQAYILKATGYPLPSLAAVSGVLPPGFTFVDSATLGIPGQAEIIAPLSITPGITLTPFTVQAANSSGSVTQALSLNYSPGPIVFHSPSSLTLTRGVPATFNVSVQGKPPLTIAPFFTPFPDGMRFVDHGGGSATLSGTPALDAAGCDPSGVGPCVFSAFDADGNELSQFFTITVLPPPTPLLSGPASATFAEGRLSTAQFRATGGLTQTHFTATIPAGISGWFQLTDFGDGTAQVAGIPPAGSAGTYNVTVFLTSDGVAGSVQTSFSAVVTGPPVFTSAATSFAHTRAFSQFMIGTSEPASFTLSGSPPAGTVFTSNPGGQSSTATLSFAPIDGSGGVYPLVITATNAYGISSQYLSANVLEAPTFSGANFFNLMIGVNRQINILANGFPRRPGFTLDTGVVSAGIGIAGGGSQLPPGTTIKPAAADGSNSGEVILTGMPAPGSQGTYGVGLLASNELGFSQQIFYFTVYAAGDANGDGVVSCLDVSLIKASLNKKKGQPGYNANADINSDGVVDIRDQAFVTAQLPKGTKCP